MRNIFSYIRMPLSVIGVLGLTALGAELAAAQDADAPKQKLEGLIQPPAELPLAPRIDEFTNELGDDLPANELPPNELPRDELAEEIMPPARPDVIEPDAEDRPFEDLLPEDGLLVEGLREETDAEASLEADAAARDKPDYSRLPESAERAARLEALFERLQAETEAETANLIAEEIWAIWLDSGSASVNMLLRRGTAAQKRGNARLARRMYNHVTELSPDYAEGWARSARLALEEEDYSRALSEATQALILEPRQFYAHWTLGNIFEKIGRNEAALEAYKEANRLYPELKAVKDRLEMIKGSVEGDVL